MSKKSTFSYVAAAMFAAAGMSPQQAWAEGLTSYENEVLAADFATVAPEGDFSIQAELAKGQAFSLSTKAGRTFSYTAERPGMHSFLVNVTAGTVDVYLMSGKVATVSLSEIYTLGGSNHVKGQNLVTGDIYSAANLFANPGFETYGSFTQGDESSLETADTRGVPADWTIVGGWRTQNTKWNAGYAVMAGQVEGLTALMMHNGAGYLTQDISGKLKANTWYKAQWRQIGHFDTSPVTIFDAYITKDSAKVAEDGANVIAHYTYSSSDKSDKDAGVANWVDPVFAFTAAEMPEKVYFLVGKQTNTINHFDCMTLQEITTGDIVFNGIDYSGESIRWEDGLTVPEGGGAVIYEDVTDQYLVNPGFELNPEGVVQIRPEDAANLEGGAWKNFGVWQPEGWTVEYGTSNEWDQGFLSVGLQHDQQQPAHKSIPGISAPAEGEYFYYFRSRWATTQVFGISQEIKQLPAGVYNLEFSASRTEGEIPVTVSVGNKSVELEGTGTGFQTYMLTLNVVNPSDYTLKVSSVKNGENYPIAVAVDGFRLIYRGDADEAAALEEAIDEMNGLYDVLYTDSELGIWPSGVRNLFFEAENLLFSVDEGSLESVSEVAQALKVCKDSADAASPVYTQLTTNYNYVATLLEKGYDDGGALKAAYDEAMNVVDPNNGDNFAAECTAADQKLQAAIRPYILAGMASATETVPFNITEVDNLQTIVSAPHFTKPNGDKTLAADRIKGNWQTNNNPASSSEYKLHTAGGLNCWNNWNNNFTSMDVYQEVANLPEGMYAIRCKHATNGVISDNHAYVQSKTGVGVSNVPTVVYEGDAFETNVTWEQVGETEKVYVEEGGTLRFGFASASTGAGGTSGWFCVTDFEVLYYAAPAGALADALNKQKEEVSNYLNDPEHAPAIMGAEKALANAAVAKADAASSRDEMLAAADELIIALDTMQYSVEQYGNFQLELDEAKFYVTDEIYPADAREIFGAVVSSVEKAIIDGASDENVSAAIFAEKKAELDAALVELEKALEKEMIIEGEKRIEGASEENPIDISDFIVNAAIDDAPADLKTVPNGWTCELSGSGNNQYTNNNEHYTGVAGNFYLDAWSGTAGALKYTASQTIMIPNGEYIIKCVGRTSGDGSYLFAKSTQTGLVTAEFANNSSVGGSIWEDAPEGDPLKDVNPDATSGEGRGFGWSRYEVRVNVIDNILTLGTSCDAEVTKGNAWTGTWFSADEFQLICVKKGWHVGIEDVNADAATLKAYVQNGYIIVEGAEDYTITTLNGATVSNVDAQFAPGVYVVKAGDKVAKVMVP